ncbi:hypothetical protein SLEP1_g13996 [Rubroshorea leprosula]|uniref:Uncharacterized protein n=1 Tax=Rubroshorea leprosula TaxID=152421 RepID=A0AAV5ISA8_9ROSI|nr:hypothetical protein SLEP1_g13996 [Rubroshorea leprosula]
MDPGGWSVESVRPSKSRIGHQTGSTIATVSSAICAPLSADDIMG